MDFQNMNRLIFNYCFYMTDSLYGSTLPNGATVMMMMMMMMIGLMFVCVKDEK